MLYISISISVLSVASVVYSTQLNGVPFSNGTSEKTRMFQRYQVLYPQPFALTYELSLNHNPGWRRFRSDGSSCSFLPLWPRPVLHLKNLNPNSDPNFRPIAKCLTLTCFWTHGGRIASVSLCEFRHGLQGSSPATHASVWIRTLTISFHSFNRV